MSADYRRGEAGRLEDGLWVILWVQVRGGTVTDLRYELYAPLSSSAIAEWLAARVVGASVAAACAQGCREAVAALELPAEAAGEALVIEDALQAALDCHALEV